MVDVTIVVKRLDDNFFQQKTLIENAYSTSSTYITNTGSSALEVKGKRENLTVNLVELLFPVLFPSQPIETNLKVYKIDAYGGGFKKKDILWYYPDALQPRVDGVDIMIDPKVTDLTGIIIEYKYEEA
jgi:hypothetical protein